MLLNEDALYGRVPSIYEGNRNFERLWRGSSEVQQQLRCKATFSSRIRIVDENRVDVKIPGYIVNADDLAANIQRGGDGRTALMV
jgi:hypothetical protein